MAMLIQFPVLGALFTALRGFGARVPFLWIADLARPDALLLTTVAGLTGLGVAMSPVAPGQAGMPRGMTIIAMVGTVAFLWSASSAFALSVGAGSVVSMIQNLVLAREAKRHSPA
jgi:membrane protein insertase Oxa1/YidC/SpoIIIJ